jgi:hypothetical protein
MVDRMTPNLPILKQQIALGMAYLICTGTLTV